MSLEFVLDYRSPYAYLANTQVKNLPATALYHVVDIVNVMKKVNNQPSPMCPAKARYSGMDAARWAKLYQVAWAPNTALMGALRERSIAGDFLSRAGLAAQALGVFEQTNSALFAAVWGGSDDLLTEAGRTQFLHKNSIDADIWALSETNQIQQQLAEQDEQAAARGVFGVPTFFVEGEMFFGNDRLDFVRAALAAVAR